VTIHYGPEEVAREARIVSCGHGCSFPPNPGVLLSRRRVLSDSAVSCFPEGGDPLKSTYDSFSNHKCAGMKVFPTIERLKVLKSVELGFRGMS